MIDFVAPLQQELINHNQQDNFVYWYHSALTGRPVIFVVDYREYDTYKAQINQAMAAALVTEQAHAPAQVSDTKPSKRFAHNVWSTKVYVMGLCIYPR